MADIELSTVYAAMQAHDAEPGGAGADRRKMAEALRAAGLMKSGTPGLVDVALSAWRNARMSGDLEQSMRAALSAVTDLITPKGKRAEVPFAEVVAAVRAEIEEAEPNGWQVAYGLIRRIGDRVRFDSETEPRAYRRRAAEDKFAGQVSRAFGKLADAGVLRKAAAGQPGPDGREVHRHQVAYYTPQMWDAIAAQAAERQAEDAAERARCERLNGRLAALGLHSTADAWKPPRLSLSRWEDLLSLAEGGMARHLASEDA